MAALMPTVFECSEGQLSQHRIELAEALKRVLGRLVALRSSGVVHDLDSAELYGEGAVYTARSRGGQAVQAVPLPISAKAEDEKLWISYRDAWGVAVRKRHFRSADLTFFRGKDAETQIFRAEWAGARKSGPSASFVPSLAGHPHWQFDAQHDGAERLQQLAAELSAPVDSTEVREFVGPGETSAGLASRSTRDLDRWRRVHFPLCATWAQSPLVTGAVPNSHAHSPKSTREIQNWVTSAIGYVIQELGDAYA